VYTAQQVHTLDHRFRAHHGRIVSRQLFSSAARNSANAERLGAGLVDAAPRRVDQRAGLRAPATPQDAFRTDAVVAEPQAP